MTDPAPRRPRLVITLGDPCGISAELLLGTLRTLCSWASILVVGAKAAVDLLEATPGRKLHWRWETPAAWTPEIPGTKILGLRTGDAPGRLDPLARAAWIDPTPAVTAADLALGEASAASGRCAVEGVRVGAGLVLSGQADALVTLPLSKHAAHLAGFNIPGHTEYLQELAGSPITRMSFVSPSLSVVLHTVHQSLRSVVEGLSVDGVAETLVFSADRFMRLAGKPGLRVALCALNPHAGENGAFGDEEALLREALAKARAAFPEDGSGRPFAQVASPFDAGPAPAGWELFPSATAVAAPTARRSPVFSGPHPSDTLFQRAVRGEFDLVVALYHDQGLIPIKVLEPSRAINLTLGLPFIRTSPDHGTAFDKAGRWQADPTNFLEAAALAVRLAGRAKREPWQALAGDAR